MPQTAIRHISAAAFVYPVSDPQQFFFQRKTDYPFPAFDGGLCPAGGNWMGAEAISDISPLWTVGREIGEEMQLEIHLRSADNEPATEDERVLAYVKRCILAALRPFGDFIHTVPGYYLRKDDSVGDPEPMTYLSSVFTAALDRTAWAALESLCLWHGNILNEGRSAIIHADGIVEEKVPITWGHAFAFRELASQLNLPQVDRVRMAPGITSRRIAMPRDRYADYRDEFTILKDPTIW